MQSNELRCENFEEPAIYRIGLFAQMNKVSIKMLRHYDEIDLMKPAFIDEETGYRYYNSEQLPILHQILALRQMDFSLEEIRNILHGDSERELLLRKKNQVMQTIAEQTMKLTRIESYLSKPEESLAYHVLLKSVPAMEVASLERVIPDYEGINGVMLDLGAEMENCGCVCSVPDYCFTMYFAEGFQEDNIRVKACQAIDRRKKDSDKIIFEQMSSIPMVASTLHKGAYDDFPKAYQALVMWIEENNYEIIGPSRELYIDGVWNKDSVEDWLTEVQFPIKKRD